tara:strand:+ start:612 stop:1121 length:510 start_codon:yes stop_codon:yes gene_type:complete
MSTTNTVTFKEATETITNLHAGLSITSNVPTHTCGTYSLINNMISDLSSIKASIKTEEKKILTDITAHMKNESGTTASMGPDTTFDSASNLTMTVSNYHCSAGLGDAASARYEDTVVKTTLPSVLNTNSKNYSESAVFTVLAQAAQHIDKLKNGIHTAGITVTETTTLA